MGEEGGYYGIKARVWTLWRRANKVGLLQSGVAAEKDEKDFVGFLQKDVLVFWPLTRFLSKQKLEMQTKQEIGNLKEHVI